MSVGRTDGLLWWRCHRNKCSYRGVHGAKYDGTQERTTHAPGRWNYAVRQLSDEWIEWLGSKFSLPDDVVSKEWAWTDSYDGRVVMPIRDPRGITTGYTLRGYNNPGTNPRWQKALTHRIAEDVGQAWYHSGPYPTHVLLVEDQPSALRASMAIGVTAIALLGTSIPSSLCDKIRWVFPYKPTVVVALDEDATAEAVTQLNKVRQVLPSAVVHRLDEDIKNMSQEKFLSTMADIRQL